MSKTYLCFLLGVLACAVLNVFGKNIAAVENCVSKIPGLTFFNISTPGYESVTQPFNRRFSPKPPVVTLPQSVSQIQSIVKCASASKVTISTSSGAHSYGAYAFSGDIVVNMTHMNSVILKPDNTVVVQTGARLGQLALFIFNQGKRALPHGSCPWIGTGGHTLYGGYGYVSRIAGLLADTVVSAEVVLANGDLVTVNSASDVELFTAVRGGGPSYGLVVSWTYQTFTAPPTTTKYTVTFPNALTVTQATNVYMMWQSFIQNKPDEFVSAAIFGPSSQGSVALEFDGNYYGPQQNALDILNPFFKSLHSDLGANLSVQSLQWLQGLSAYAGGDGSLNTTAAPDTHDTYYAKSLVTTSPDSKSNVEAFINYLATNGSKGRSDTNYFVQVDLYGGQIARGGKETSFDHRNAFLVYQFYASSETSNPPYPSDGIAFVNGIVKTLDNSPAPPGYPNYMDTALAQDDLWKKSYYPTKAQQLQNVKDRVDPHGLFDFPEGF